MLVAGQGFGTQGALDDFIHPSVHLHTALLGVCLLEWRGHTWVDLGQDSLVELQVIEALGGHVATISFAPVADLRRGRTDGVTVHAVWWKGGQEPLHPGAMKPVQLLLPGIYGLRVPPQRSDWLIENSGVQALIDLTKISDIGGIGAAF